MSKFIVILSLITFTPWVAAADLISVYQAALKNDPQLRANGYLLEAGKYRKKQQTAAFLPSIELNGSYSENQNDNLNPSDYHSHVYSIDLSQVIYRHQLVAEYQIAKNQLNESEHLYVHAKQNLMLRLADQYFNLLAALDNLDFANAETTAVKKQLDQVKKRFEVGVIASTDVQESKARFDLTVAQQIEAENNLSLQIEVLREITGEYYDRLNGLNNKMVLEAPIPDNMDHWVDQAIKNSPMLGAAEAKLAQSKAAVNLARAGHVPNVDLKARFQEADNPASFVSGNQTSISVELSAPIFQSGLTHYKVKEAQQRFFGAQQEHERTRREIHKQTRAAYLNVKAAIARAKALEQALISSKIALEATRKGFNAGTRTSVDILDSQRELFRAKRDYSRARYDYLVNHLQLKLLSGTLEEKDLHEINEWLTETAKN